MRRTKAKRIISTNNNIIDKINHFEYRNSKMEKNFAYEYHHVGANQKNMDIIHIQDKSRKTLQLMKERREKTKPSNLWIRFDNISNQTVWIPAEWIKKGKMRCRQLIRNFYSRITKETDRAPDISSSTNRRQARAWRGTEKNLPKICRAPRKVKWQARRPVSLSYI